MVVDNSGRAADLAGVNENGLGRPAFGMRSLIARKAMPPKKRWTVLMLQGANMNYLGRREPERYGTTTAAEVDRMMMAYTRPQNW